MSLILCLESSAALCSVALFEGPKLLSLIESDEAFAHTRKITVFVQHVLDKAGKRVQDLNAVAISHGPGSYTGLRVSASTAKGICYALKIPLIAIPTLEAIAYEVRRISKAEVYVPMIDARRMEVYYKAYDDKMEIIRPTDNLILELGVFDEFIGKKVILCGDGAMKAQEINWPDNIRCLPFRSSAKFIGKPAFKKYRDKEFESIHFYEPFYFKPPKVTKSKKKLF